MLGTIVLLHLLSEVGSENFKIWFELKGILFMTMNSRNNQLFTTDELKVESKYLVHVFAIDGYTYGLNTAGCKDCSLCSMYRTIYWLTLSYSGIFTYF